MCVHTYVPMLLFFFSQSLKWAAVLGLACLSLPSCQVGCVWDGETERKGHRWKDGKEEMGGRSRLIQGKDE